VNSNDSSSSTDFSVTYKIINNEGSSIVRGIAGVGEFGELVVARIFAITDKWKVKIKGKSTISEHCNVTDHTCFLDFFKRPLCVEFQLRENKLVETLDENIKCLIGLHRKAALLMLQ